MNLSFKNFYWRWIKNQFFLFLVFLFILTLARATFALYFGDWKTLTAHLPDLRRAFFLGLRFDLMPLAYVNVLPFIILNIGFFIPGDRSIRTIRSLMVSLLFVGYFLIAWLWVFDYGFFSYFQDHLNILFFGFFEDDTRALVTSIWKNYNLPLWLTLIFFLHYGLFRFVRFLFSPFEFDIKTPPKTHWAISCFVMGLVSLAFLARGNFTRRPLSVEDAHVSRNDFINKVALNGALSFNRAIKIRKIFGKARFDYLKDYGFGTWQEAFEVIHGEAPKFASLKSSLKTKTAAVTPLGASKPHTVMVVMESFGTSWNDKDSEQFQILGELKQHFKTGLLFENFLPSDNGTIGSIVSISTSQVTRPGARYLSESEFMNTPLSAAGHLPFKESGYDTHFIYGGKLGWRDLGKYLAAQGYDHLWGADEIKDAMPELNNFSPRDLGNEWGIFDEYLYSFIDEQIRTATRPQFFLVLTTSNHPPFEYPSSYAPLSLDLTDEVLETVTVDADIAKKRFLGFQYSNQKMGEFLTRIRTSTLKDKVVVALTGDHSFWIAKGVGLEEDFKRYAVPFYISTPTRYDLSGVDTSKFGSHEDIFPTLYNLILPAQEYLRLGDNLLSDSSGSINATGLVANADGAYHHGSFWKWKDLKGQVLEPAQPGPELLKLKRRSEALISITDLYLKEEMKSKLPAEGNDQQ
ncbi:MAG TPA: LTA synthase family protein [Bacteriovoracaceae bacterium]|nr:LTA synthase family protein [Bacteriovoracaceae bacterium]